MGLSFSEANELMATDPQAFRSAVQKSLRRQVSAINGHHARGTYFFDYGNAFLLEASRAGGDVMAPNGVDFKYPSYVQDILGPMCFDYGFGPFRWVCTSGNTKDLQKTDAIALPIDRVNRFVDQLAVRRRPPWPPDGWCSTGQCDGVAAFF